MENVELNSIKEKQNGLEQSKNEKSYIHSYSSVLTFTAVATPKVVDELSIINIVMGNLGKPLNFPLAWTRKGAVEPRRSNWYCAARVTCENGKFSLLSQSTACRVVMSFWYLKAVTVNLVRRGPIPGC